MDISYLLFLQRARIACGGIFDQLFLYITEFGVNPIAMLVFAWLYWCVSKKVGAAVGWNIGIACSFNSTIKEFFKIDRPWIRDARVTPVDEAVAGAPGYSFPSGHTTRATAVWGTPATYALFPGLFKNKIKNLPKLNSTDIDNNFIQLNENINGNSLREELRTKTEERAENSQCHGILGILGWLVVLAIGFSRNYLGVHTPQDVAVALILGIAFIFVIDRVLSWADKTEGRYDLYIAAAGVILCGLPMIKLGYFGNAATGMGIFAGWYVERRFVRFEEPKTFTERATVFAIGVIPLLFIGFVLSDLLAFFIPSNPASFIKNALLGFYIMGGYPFAISYLYRKKIIGPDVSNPDGQEARSGQSAGRKSSLTAVITAAIILILAVAAAYVGHHRQLEKQIAEEIAAADEAATEADYTRKMDVIAHRGYPDVAPENTISSFKYAMDLGVDWIETDVQLTKDGVLVLFHDNEIARITGNTGTIADYTYDELMQMDAGAWFSPKFAGTKIPTLKELCDLAQNYDTKIYLELKDIGERSDFAPRVYEMIEEAGLHDRVVYASFQYDYLKQLKEADASVPVLFNAKTGDDAMIAEEPAEYYGINFELVTKELVSAIHDAGSTCFVWTVDSPQQMENLYRMGVDGIVSNKAGTAMVASHPEYSFIADNCIEDHAMPGLYDPTLGGEHADMVWQGFTKANNLLITSAYCKSGEHNSVLYIMNTAGDLLNVVDLGFKAHTGGIAYDRDHDILWSTGPDGMVYALSMPAIADGSYNGEILAQFDAGLYNTDGGHVASFLAFDSGELYVGSYCNGGDGTLNRYDVSDINAPQLISAVTIPERIQGVTFRDVAYGRQMLMTQGYETDDGELLCFTYDDAKTEYLVPDMIYTLPEGPEQILWTSRGLYMQFESAALPYRESARVAGDRLWLVQLTN